MLSQQCYPVCCLSLQLVLYYICIVYNSILDYNYNYTDKLLIVTVKKILLLDLIVICVPLYNYNIINNNNNKW